MRTTLCLLALLSAPLFAADLSDADRKAIEQIHKTYVDAWLAGDPGAVMKLFSADAVLIPHHGLPPVVGEHDIRKWWWPASSSVTTITSFTMTLDQLGGSGRMAFVRGTQKLEWTTGDKMSRNRGNHLMLFRKQGDGRWVITHQMWGDPAN